MRRVVGAAIKATALPCQKGSSLCTASSLRRTLASSSSSLPSSSLGRYGLYLITDDAYLDENFCAKIEAALCGGVTCVQFRLKHASTASYIHWAEKVKVLTRQFGVPLIIDDRLDVALAVDAEGLHVGGEDLPWRTARRLLGSHRILGCSTYGRADLVCEALHPEVRADYLGSGAVFATSTKQSSVPKGIEHLMPLRALISQEAGQRDVPLVAIGGVGTTNAATCIEAGADGVAAVSALLGHSSAAGTRTDTAEMLASIQDALNKRSLLH